MSGFLDGYEDVNARIKRFRSEFPTGRLEASVEDFDVQRGYILVKAQVFREYEDTVPSAIDFAFEMRSDRGVNRDFWVENCVTSAYGRVISALTPSEARPTRQDMEKVERLSAADIAARDNLDVWNASAQAKEQISRESKDLLPTLKMSSGHNFRAALKGKVDEIDLNDFILLGYDPHPAIKAPLSN